MSAGGRQALSVPVRSIIIVIFQLILYSRLRDPLRVKEIFKGICKAVFKGIV